MLELMIRTSFDMVSRGRLDEYLAFLDTYRYGKSSADFSIIPLGFSPYLYELEGYFTEESQIEYQDIKILGSYA